MSEIAQGDYTDQEWEARKAEFAQLEEDPANIAVDLSDQYTPQEWRDILEKYKEALEISPDIFNRRFTVFDEDDEAFIAFGDDDNGSEYWSAVLEAAKIPYEPDELDDIITLKGKVAFDDLLHALNTNGIEASTKVVFLPEICEFGEDLADEGIEDFKQISLTIEDGFAFLTHTFDGEGSEEYAQQWKDVFENQLDIPPTIGLLQTEGDTVTLDLAIQIDEQGAFLGTLYDLFDAYGFDGAENHPEIAITAPVEFEKGPLQTLKAAISNLIPS